MGVCNFADSYKAAGLFPGPEIIGLRQEPFDKLSKELNTQMVFDLTRLYFGLSVPNATEWFREAFSETDVSFSMVDNAQEVAVLASCILKEAIANGKGIAALAVLTTSAGGNRNPLVFPELIEEARLAMIDIAVEHRNNQKVDIKQIKLPVKTTIHEEADALAAAPDWVKTVKLFKTVDDENIKSVKNLSNQIQKVLHPLVNEVTDLQEEVSMLWWHIGGWSRILEKPFIELSPELVAAMAGLDLADLSKTLAGPVAVPAILHRTIFASNSANTTKATVKGAVNSFPTEAFEKLKLGDGLKGVSDVCPVLTGFLKAYEVGESPAWEIAFKKSTQLDASVSFDLLELAMQVYRERSLLAAID